MPQTKQNIPTLLDSNLNLGPAHLTAHTLHKVPGDSIVTTATSFTATEASAWVTVLLTLITGLVGVWYKYIKKPILPQETISEKTNESPEPRIERRLKPRTDENSEFETEHPKTIENLTNHSFFSDIKKYERLVKYNFHVEQKVKLEVYKDFLMKKLSIWEQLLYELAEDIDKKCASCTGTGGCTDCNSGFSITELKNLHIDTLAKGIELYNDYYNCNDYTDEEKDLCRHAAACFNMFHKDKVELVESVIYMLDKSFRFSKCPKVLTDMILNTYTVAFILAFKDMTAVIEASNGYFEGKNFRKRSYNISQLSSCS